MKTINVIDKRGIDSATSAMLGGGPYAGEDCDWGVARSIGLADTYTGNLSFETRDLSCAGAVGRYGLSWSRVATSRARAGQRFSEAGIIGGTIGSGS